MLEFFGAYRRHGITKGLLLALDTLGGNNYLLKGLRILSHLDIDRVGSTYSPSFGPHTQVGINEHLSGARLQRIISVEI